MPPCPLRYRKQWGGFGSLSFLSYLRLQFFFSSWQHVLPRSIVTRWLIYYGISLLLPSEAESVPACSYRKGLVNTYGVYVEIYNLDGLSVFCSLYGFSSGSIPSLSFTVIAQLSPDSKLVCKCMVMSFSFVGLCLFKGNPTAGAVLDIPAGNLELGPVVVAAGAICFLLSGLEEWEKIRGGR